jgi:hypothetical protein
MLVYGLLLLNAWISYPPYHNSLPARLSYIFLSLFLSLSSLSQKHIFCKHSFSFLPFLLPFFYYCALFPYHLSILFPIMLCVLLGTSKISPLSISIKKTQKNIVHDNSHEKEMCTDFEIIAPNNDDCERTDISTWLRTATEYK